MDVTNIVKRDRETFIKYLLHVENQLKKLYGNTYAKAMQLQQVRESIEAGAPFTWKGNPQAEKQLDKLLNNMAQHTDQLIVQGVTKQYTNGQKAATQMVDANFAHNKKVVADLSQEATEQHRLSVSKTFTSATGAQGMTLSKRVWALNDQSKTELEIAIQNAIIEGKSADEASRDIRKYLSNPNALFKRVRDKETGELVLSDAAKNYHPGQGVYRSAYKNAMRMARTEINAAYLRAEIESYQSNPLVTGYEIKLSGNHTTTLPNGKVVHLTDICDKLAGKYPKTFMFTGWHPQCRCYIVPITIKDKEANKLIDDKGTITPDDTQGKQIDKLPNNMQKWLTDNQPRIDSARQLPPFIEDNKQLIEPTKEPEPKKPTPQEIADKRHAERTAEQVADIKARWKEHNVNVNKAKIMDLYKAVDDGYLSESVKTTLQTIEDANNLADFDTVKNKIKAFETAIQRHKNRSADEIRRIQDDVDARKFGQQYVDNVHKIEQSLGVKRGKRMTHEEADRGNENPNYKQGGGYKVNCQTCVPTYALRRLGFNVEALPNINGDAYIKMKNAGITWEQRFVNIDGSNVKYERSSDWAKTNQYKQITEKRINDFISEKTQDEGFYEVYCMWKKGHAHVFCVSRENGKLFFRDPQSHENDVHYYTREMLGKWVYVLRIDDKLINTKVCNLFKIK